LNINHVAWFDPGHRPATHRSSMDVSGNLVMLFPASYTYILRSFAYS